jgi:outer membrane protein
VKRFGTLFISALLLLSVSTHAAGQESLSLSDAISHALEKNYTISIVRQGEEIASVNNTWGAAGRFPTISLDLLSNSRSEFNETRDFTSSALNPGMDLNWVLFNGFAIKIRKERFDSLSELSQGNTAVIVENTIQAVILSYYNILLQQERLKAVKDILELSSDRYQYVLTKKDIGNAVTFDVLQAKNAWLEDKSNYMLQEMTLKNAVRDLNYLMGISGDVSYTFSDDFTAESNDWLLDDLKAKMLDNNKTLRNQYINEVLLGKNIDLARSMYYPSLNVRTGIDGFRNRTNFEDADPAYASSHSYYANLSLSFNLFDGGAKKRAVAIAKIQEDIGKTETKEMIHSLSNNLEKLFEMYNVRRDLYSVTKENLEAAKLNMEISGDRFAAGTINSFNYRDVQLIYLNAAINRLQAVYSLIDTKTALMRITGGIITER